jgi:hypothetical protein
MKILLKTISGKMLKVHRKPLNNTDLYYSSKAPLVDFTPAPGDKQ